jgi:hypothetical protein
MWKSKTLCTYFLLLPFTEQLEARTVLSSFLFRWVNYLSLQKVIPPFIGYSLFIHSFINGSTALVGPRPLLRFRNLFYTNGRSPWTSDQPVARPLHTHRTTQTRHKCTQTSMPWMGFEPTNPASEDSSCLRPCGHCDRRIQPLYSFISGQLSRYSDGLRVGRPAFDFRYGIDIFLFSTASKPALGPNQPPIGWTLSTLSPGVK